MSSANDIPIEWLEIPFIQQCSNEGDLAGIIAVLRSGREGVYPHLERAAEKRMNELNPHHRILRKAEQMQKTAALGDAVSVCVCVYGLVCVCVCVCGCGLMWKSLNIFTHTHTTPFSTGLCFGR